MASQAQTLSPMTQPENLWQKALGTLDDDLKSSLDYENTSRRDLLAAVLKTAQRKKQLCLEKRWKIKKSNGEELILRDVVEKIIVWLDKFKTIGDLAMQYDPTHAALPWAGVRFLLRVAVSEKQVFGATIECLETVSRLITRYAIFENLYMPHDSTARDELKGALTSLYAEVLRFLAKATRFFKTSTMVRIIKTVYQPAEDLQMQRIAAQEANVLDLAKLVDAEIRQETSKGVRSIRKILEELEAPINRLAQQTVVPTRSLDEEKHLKLLRWLSSVPFSRHNDRLSQNRIPTSGKWLLDHPQFLTWKASSSSAVMLLHGVAGSGKSSLASTVVDSFLQEVPRDVLPVQLAYFYCAKGAFEYERSDPDEIFRSLVRQLTFAGDWDRQVHEALLIEYERREAIAKLDGFDVPRLRAFECVKLMLDAMGSNPAVLIIDAVDEINKDRRHELLNALHQVVKESTSVVKVFVTTRNNSNVFALSPGAFTICIHSDSVRGDMELFVRHHVNLAAHSRRLLNGNVSDELREYLIETLLAEAEEMFLWVILQIDNLCRMRHAADVRAAARRLSMETLNQLYAETFREITNAGSFTCTMATQTFCWLLCAQEALKPAAILEAVTMTIGFEEERLDLSQLLDVCFNLIVLDSNLNVLRFAHTSIQEFLEARPEFALQHVHSLAASACLNICTQGPPNITGAFGINLSAARDFYRYASLYWPEHCNIGRAAHENRGLLQRMEEFVFDDTEISLSFASWLHDIHDVFKTLADDHRMKKAIGAVTNANLNPLFTACAFGLLNIVDRCDQEGGFDWNQKNSFGQTGIYIACATGHASVVRALIERGADINATGGKYMIPLHVACFAGNLEVVRLLLEHGAHAKTRGVFDNALQAAILGDHEDIAVMLLQNHFELSSREDYESITKQAAEAGFAEIISLLTKRYASYGDDPSAQYSAIDAAILKGRVRILEHLFQRSSIAEHDLPRDAISSAAFGGHNSMITLLLGKGQGIEQEGKFGTPLRAACLMGHESTVRLLLNCGADVNVCGTFGGALQASAMKSHIAITQLLIQEGADLDLDGGSYGNALQAAAYHGHQTVVELLIRAGANIHQHGVSKDALHAAAEGGREVIVRILLEKIREEEPEFSYRGSEPQYMRRGRKSPGPFRQLLRDASPTRFNDNAELPPNQSRSLDWGSCASTPDVQHISMDSTAPTAHEWYEDVPLSRRNNQRVGDEQDYAVQAAASKNYDSVVGAFLDFSKEHTAFSQFGSALKEAATRGHQNTVSRIIASEIDMEFFLDAALKGAAFHGHLGIVNILLGYEKPSKRTEDRDCRTVDNTSSGQDSINLSIERVETILVAGCQGAHESVVAQAIDLLDRHFSPWAKRKSRSDALRAAAQHMNGDIISLLLNCKIMGEAIEVVQAFEVACEYGNKSALLRLLENDSCKTMSPQQYSLGLKKAAMSGHCDIIHLLLRQSPSRYTQEALEQTLLIGCGYGFFEVAQSLINGFQGHQFEQSLLNLALNFTCSKGHEKVAAMLIQAGADVNALSVPNILDQIAFEMLLPGAVLKAKEVRTTALQATIYGSKQNPFWPFGMRERTGGVSGREATVQLLLKHNADVNTLSALQVSPLHTAIDYGTPSVVNALIAGGAKLHPTGERKESLLQLAACRELNGADVMREIIKTDAKILSDPTGIKYALEHALAFFGGRNLSSRDSNYAGEFREFTSINTILEEGPGAVVKMMLSSSPNEKAENIGYGLLLQMAAIAGDCECTQLLIRHQVDINASGYYYGTALQAASRVGNTQIVKTLLRASADVNILLGVYGTALRAAVKGNHTSVASLLIRHGAAVNLRFLRDDGHSQDDQPILHLALNSRNGSMIKMLLANGADINALDTSLSENPSPLHEACAMGCQSLVSMLLAHGADIGLRIGNSKSPLEVAASAGHSQVIRLLIEAGADIDSFAVEAGADIDSFAEKSPGTALYIAADMGYPLVVQELVTAGASIASPPDVPNALAAACLRHQHSIAEYLIEELHGNVNEESICSEALAAACASHDDKMAQILLERLTLWPPETLHQICAAGLEGSLRMMLECGVNMKSIDDKGGHAIHVAASHLQSGVMRLLIDHGADAHFVSEYYGSPLIAALEGCLAPLFITTRLPQHLESALPRAPPSWRMWFRRSETYFSRDLIRCRSIVQMLIDQGVDDMDDTRRFGKALHIASFIGDEQMVQLLIDMGSSINSIGGWFGTPLFAAVQGQNARSIELLLKTGADLNTCIGQQDTPLSRAVAYNIKMGGRSCYESVARYLLSCGKKLQIKECDLVAAAAQRDPIRGEDHYLKLLLTYDQEIKITQTVINAAVGNRAGSGQFIVKNLELLNERCDSITVTEDMLMSTRHPEVMEFLLQQKIDFPITLTILEAVARNEHEGRRLFQLLIDYAADMPITEAVVIIALKAEKHGLRSSTEDSLHTLLKRNSKLSITDDMLKAARHHEDMDCRWSMDRRSNFLGPY